MDTQIKRCKSQFSPKNLARFARMQLTSYIFFQFLLLIYNSRTIVIKSFLSQEYLQVFMYIMCFNVTICFKMGSLYSLLLLWHNNQASVPSKIV